MEKSSPASKMGGAQRQGMNGTIQAVFNEKEQQ